jgi:hypothetical protein
MPGGITNENIQKVMDLRQSDTKSGWGNVAKQLNLNLGFESHSSAGKPAGMPNKPMHTPMGGGGRGKK